MILQLRQWSNAIFQRIKRLIGKAGSIGTDESRGEEVLVLAADFPNWKDLEQHLMIFPERYRETFAVKPLNKPDLFVGREDERLAFEGVFERWRQGRSPILALVGPDGSGKTTFLTRIEAELQPSAEITKVSFRGRVRTEKDLVDVLSGCFEVSPNSNTVDDLINSLVKLPRRVVLVDELHCLVLRALGATRVAQAFLAILLATRGRFFWVVSFKDYAWRRLDYQVGLANSFTDIIHLTFFTEEELKTALGLRLDDSGLALGETATDDQTVEQDHGVAQDETEDQTVLDRCFPELYSSSKGNMRAALFYWALSTHYDESNGAVLVRPCPKVDLSSLRMLGDIYNFTLAELLTHGGLTPQEHAEIFQRNELESRLILEYLVQQRFVLKSSLTEQNAEQIYRVDPIFYISISSALESAHILY